MSNFKAGAFFNEGNIVEVGLRNPDAPADGDGGLYARDVVRGVELPGGGGGDFSTAEVTIQPSGASSGVTVLYMPIIRRESMIMCFPLTSNDSGDYIAPLYKGVLIISGNGVFDSSNIVSGQATLSENGDIIIQGNCVLALNASD